MSGPVYKLVGSYPTQEGLIKRLENYFYSQIFLKGNGKEYSVHNSTGPIDGYRVVLQKYRWRLERIVS